MGIESSIQSLCGNLVSGKCYPVLNTTGTSAPYVTFQRVTGFPFGLSVVSDETVFQIDVFGRTYDEAKVLAASIKSALWASITLPNVKEMEFDEYDEVGRVYRVMMQFRFWIA